MFRFMIQSIQSATFIHKILGWFVDVEAVRQSSLVDLNLRVTRDAPTPQVDRNTDALGIIINYIQCETAPPLWDAL